MSFTGPGCERCNFTGRTTFPGARPPFNQKPCDSCGGLSTLGDPNNTEVHRLRAALAKANGDLAALNERLAALRTYAEHWQKADAVCLSLIDRDDSEEYVAADEARTDAELDAMHALLRLFDLPTNDDLIDGIAAGAR